MTAVAASLINVTMPQMGVSVEEGTVLAWAVGAGDLVVSGQTICEIATDKVETDVPAPADGVVREVLIDVGETVPVGSVLATIDPRDVPRSRRGHSPVVLRVAGEWVGKQNGHQEEDLLEGRDYRGGHYCLLEMAFSIA